MALTNAYCDLEDLKILVGDIPDSADDVALEIAINAASRQIDGYCGQRFYSDTDAVARYFYVVDGQRVRLDQEDVAGIGTVDGDFEVKADIDGDGVYETTLTRDVDFILGPVNAALQTPAAAYDELVLGLNGGTVSSLPLSTGRPTLKITAIWGWPAVPDDIKQACLLQAAQLWKSKDAVFGVASFGEFGALRVRSAMNPIAEGLLFPYLLRGVG